MNQPPSGDGDDDMERRFQTGLQDDGAPSEAVRRAILDHASRMAVEHARSQPGGRRPAMLTARRRNTIFGALAAAVFAGLLVVPILRTPVVHRQGPVAQGPVAPPPNRETASQSAPGTSAAVGASAAASRTPAQQHDLQRCRRAAKDYGRTQTSPRKPQDRRRRPNLSQSSARRRRQPRRPILAPPRQMSRRRLRQHRQHRRPQAANWPAQRIHRLSAASFFAVPQLPGI